MPNPRGRCDSKPITYGALPIGIRLKACMRSKRFGGSGLKTVMPSILEHILFSGRKFRIEMRCRDFLGELKRHGYRVGASMSNILVIHRLFIDFRIIQGFIFYPLKLC